MENSTDRKKNKHNTDTIPTGKKRDNFDRIISLVFVLCLVIFAINIFFKKFNIAVNELTGNNVTDKLKNVIINIKDTNGNYVVKDNESVEGAIFTYGSEYELTVSWEMESEREGLIGSGDYLLLDIGNHFFKYKNTKLNNELKYRENKIGEWGIKDNKIQNVFKDSIGSYLASEGYFYAKGSFVSKVTGIQDMTIAGVEIHGVTCNPQANDFPVSNFVRVRYDSPIVKNGELRQDASTIQWDILVNAKYEAEYYYSKMKKEMMMGKTALDSVLIKDELPEDLVISNMAMEAWIYRPRSSTELSGILTARISITSQFNEVNQKEGQSEEEWINELKTYAKAYGVSENRKKLYVWVENISDLMLAADEEDFDDKVILNTVHKLTTEERNALKRIYGEDGAYPVRGFAIKVQSEASSGRFEKEGYKNTAYLVENGREIGYDSQSVSVGYRVEGGEKTVSHNAKLVIKDFNTQEPVSGAEVKLQYYSGGIWQDYQQEETVVTKTTNSDGELTFDRLPPTTYRFVEVKAGEGYDAASAIYSEEQFAITPEDTEKKVIYATNKVLGRNITIRKVWEDYNNEAGIRPDAVGITLYADGKEYRTTVLTRDNVSVAADGMLDETVWEYTFTNLPVYSSTNLTEIIDYTVSEESCAHYIQSVEGYTITDTLNLRHSVKLIKRDYNTRALLSGARFKLQYLSQNVWLDYTIGGNPDIRTTDENGEIEYTDLPAGRYKFVEIDAKEGYNIESATYSANPFEIYPTDTREVLITATNQVYNKDITVTKVWADSNNLANMRPNFITLILMDGALEVRRETLSEKNATSNPNIWEYIFRDLPVYFEDTDRVIDYTVREEAIENYETEIDGYTVTDTLKINHVAGLSASDYDTGTKIEGARFKLQYQGANGWEDYREEGVVAIKQTDSEGKLEFSELPSGKYRFVEVAAKTGFNIETAKYSENSFVISDFDTTAREITLTNEVFKTDITVQKVWDDFDNMYGVRPEAVTVRLMNGSNEAGVATITMADAVTDHNGIKNLNKWEYTFEGVPEYDGKTSEVIHYTLRENQVDKYHQEIDGYIITNSLDFIHTIRLTKTDDATGEKLKGVGFKLQYMDGTDWIDYQEDGVVAIRQTDADGTLEFAKLPAGKYRFVEVKAKEGYDINSAEYSENEFVILSTDTQVKQIYATNKVFDKNITVKKIWKDYDNAAGIRPETITVRLMNGGQTVQTVNLTAENAVMMADGVVDNNVWEYTFTDIPVYDENTNEVICYTVAEDFTPDYNQSVNGYVITDTLKLTHSVRIRKLDFNTGAAIDGAEFKLQYLNGMEWEDYTVDGSVVTKTTNQEGILEFSGLLEGTYRAIEIIAKDGYSIESAVYSENSIVILPTDTVTREIVVTNRVSNKNITVKKIWEDESNGAGLRPVSVTIRLMSGNNEIRNTTLTQANAVRLEDGSISKNEWEYTFVNLPVYDGDTDHAFAYTITEDRVDHYERSTNGYTITNTLRLVHSVKLNMTDYNTGDAIEGAKFKLQYLSENEWIDYKEEGIVIVKRTDNQGVLEFYDIPVGTYRFVETAAKVGYDVNSAEYSESMFEIRQEDTRTKERRVTNRMGDISITVTKVWTAQSDAGTRPAVVRFILLDGDSEVTRAELSDKDAIDNGTIWKHVFGGLPVYHGNTGRAVNYVLKEDIVAGYGEWTDETDEMDSEKSAGGSGNTGKNVSENTDIPDQGAVHHPGSDAESDIESNADGNAAPPVSIMLGADRKKEDSEGYLSYTEYLNSLKNESVDYNGGSRLIKVISNEQPSMRERVKRDSKPGDRVVGVLILILAAVFGCEVIYGIVSRKKEE